MNEVDEPTTSPISYTATNPHGLTFVYVGPKFRACMEDVTEPVWVSFQELQGYHPTFRVQGLTTRQIFDGIDPGLFFPSFAVAAATMAELMRLDCFEQRHLGRQPTWPSALVYPGGMIHYSHDGQSRWRVEAIAPDEPYGYETFLYAYTLQRQLAL